MRHDGRTIRAARFRDWAGTITIAATLGAACLVACDRKDDLFGARSEPGGSADAGAADVPVVPFLVDPAHRDDCETCARRKCRELQRICAADPDCRQMLECLGKCDNTSCARACELQPSVAKDAPHVQASQRYIDLHSCVLGNADLWGLRADRDVETACAEDCNAGANFDCAGRHTRPAPERQAQAGLDLLEVRWFITTGGPIGLPGLRVRSCLATWSTCRPGPDDSVEGARSDAYGRAVLPVGLFDEDAFAQGSRVYFEIDGPDNPNVLPMLLHISDPLLADADIRMSWDFNPTVVQTIFERGDQDSEPVDLSRGLLQVEIRDCTGMLGPRYGELTIEGLDSAPFLPEPRNDEEYGVWSLSNLPDGEIELKGSIKGRLVSRHKVWVRHGAVTYAPLFPGARQDVPASGP